MRKPKRCPVCETALIIEPNSLYGEPGLRITCPVCNSESTAIIIEPETPRRRADGQIVTLEDIEAEAVRYWRGEEGIMA